MNSSSNGLVSIFRVVFLLVFALYWGGLTFYTGFVVRISHDVLNDPIDGGLITQRATETLQLLGVATLALMTCNGVAVVRLSKNYGIGLLVNTLVLGVSLIGLFVVHAHLDAVIDVDASEVVDRSEFIIGHRRYNQLTTVEWVASVVYLVVTVFAWHSIDQSSYQECSA